MTENTSIEHNAEKKSPLLPVLHHIGFSDGGNRLRRTWLGMEVSYGEKIHLSEKQPVTAYLTDDRGKTEEEAFAEAMANLEKQDVYLVPVDFAIDALTTDIAENAAVNFRKAGMPDIFHIEKDVLRQPGLFLYTLSLETPVLTASVILRKDVLEKAAELFGEGFAVLPSSCHEVLLLPKSHIRSAANVNRMVTEVNDQEVSPEERLLNHALFYDRERKELGILE